MQRNFLKKKYEENEMKQIVDMNYLDSLDLPESILVYEIDFSKINIMKTTKKIQKYFSLVVLLNNLLFVGNFTYLFERTFNCYVSTYGLNITLFCQVLTNHKLFANRIFQMEYLQKEKKVKLVKQKGIFFNKTKEYIISIDNLERYHSTKIYENMINLRNKTSNELYSFTENGIWHNKQIFEAIFGKLDEVETKLH